MQHALSMHLTFLASAPIPIVLSKALLQVRGIFESLLVSQFSGDTIQIVIKERFNYFMRRMHCF